MAVSSGGPTLRVLMVVRPAAGGIKGHVVLLARGLVAREIEVEVAAPEGSDVLLETAAEGLAGSPLDIVGPLSPPKDWAAVRALRAIIDRGDFDVVHAHGFKAGLVARLAARRTGVPVVVTAHNHVLRRADFSPRRKAIYRRAERSLAPLVARWIAVSDSVRSELLDDYGLPPERVARVRNGIDLASFLERRDRAAARAAFGVAEGVPFAATAARLAPQKGLETLIDALPTLLERVPDARVAIVGEGPLEGDLRVRAVAAGVGEALLWPGRVGDIGNLFAAVDAYVSPSELEGFGLVLAEAQAAGTPIVATRAGGAAEVVEEDVTALVVEPGDPGALGDAIAQVLSQPHLRHVLGDAGRKRAIELFDPDRMVTETLAVYEDAIADPKGTSGA
ncbi:MAG: glycosyltransferase family 4 protein [Coriobacteriales bacterium]|nr:glycosyltransferase family 4 protein [Coriobacteriales bacterium]